MADAYDGPDRRDQAIQELQGAAMVAPEYPNVHFELGYLFWKKREFDKAEVARIEQLQSKPREELQHKISGPPPTPPVE